MDLKQIYSSIIMEHSNNSEHKHELEHATHNERGHNPSCGDDIQLHLNIDGDIIKEAAFTGHGCAISQASTSLLCELIEGKTIEEARLACQKFIGMITGDEDDMYELEDILGDAVALQNISVMPQRVKCAVLAWHTLSDMLEK